MNNWGHLVGKNVEEARKDILASNPELKIVVIAEGSPVT